MLKINELPIIKLEDIGEDINKLLTEDKIQFLALDEAPKFIKFFSYMFNESYISYKNTIYIPAGHVALATSKNPSDRIVAASKILPWAYAIKNGSVASIYNLLHTMTDISIRSYYFLYEFALLKSHELPEIPDLVATGFISSRRTILNVKRNPEKVLKVLKGLLQSKVDRT